MRNSVRRARQGKCPRAKEYLHLFSEGSGRASAQPCGSWCCSYCGWVKSQVCRLFLTAGAVTHHNRLHDPANPQIPALRFLTLTQHPDYPFQQVSDLSAAWNRLRTDYKRRGLIDEYALTVETTPKNGHLHLHALVTGQRIEQDDLSKDAARHGFGYVCDISAVEMSPDAGEDDPASVGYLAKRLTGYVSKQHTTDALQEKTKVRRRPLRASRGWYPGGQARAREELLRLWYQDGEEPGEKDPGPWWVVIGDPAGHLTIRGRDQDGEPVTIKDSGRGCLPSEGSERGERRQPSDLSDATERREAA